MSYSIEQLRTVPDDVLIREHDQLAARTSVGVDFYLQELDRRDRARGETAALKLARASNRLSIIAVVLSVLSLVAGAVVPLLS